jgi:hypothetical protein
LLQNSFVQAYSRKRSIISSFGSVEFRKRMDGLDLLNDVQDAPWDRSGHCPARQAILILGMDRSGTSMITHILHSLGAALPRKLIGPSHGNPSGHWEPWALVALNREILGRLGRRWDDPRPLPEPWFRSREAQNYIKRITAEIERSYPDAPLLAIKDPRLCRLLPLYLEALDGLDIAPLVILQVRPVAEVTQSLTNRDNLPLDLSTLLWLRSVTEAEWHSRHLPRIWVSFGQVASNWRHTIDRIGDRLAVTWPTHPNDAAERIDLLLKPRPRQVASGPDNAILAQVWEAIQAGLADDDPTARAGFDEVRAFLQAGDLIYTEVMSHHIRRLEAELRAMRRSTCWRLTAPLRALGRWVKGEQANKVDLFRSQMI